MDNTIETTDLATLLAELDRLRHTIATALPSSPSPGEDLRLIARLTPGLDSEQYERLLAAVRDQGWFFLSLPPSGYPNLHALLQFVDSLPDDSCPLTQALSPRSFARKLHEEAERAHRHNADLALIVLSGAGPMDGQSLLVLAEAARLEMGGGDALALLDQDHLAIIAPTARQLKARALAERILDRFTASVPLSPEPSSCQAARAGIACFSPDEAPTDATQIAETLREHSLAALETAPANQARIHQRDTRPMSERSVLVQAGEKQFLFFGNMEHS
ncbi:MAG: GGDEF domain-containing protein [Deltaproteobacteria bacterium]|jgi:GGDEF domain-containing protein|nr:GGDEF domain-containing protein [Deltaproteobacteria bacterium]